MKYILTSLVMLALLATTACTKSENEDQAAPGSETRVVNAEAESPAAEAEEAPVQRRGREVLSVDGHVVDRHVNVGGIDRDQQRDHPPRS